MDPALAELRHELENRRVPECWYDALVLLCEDPHGPWSDTPAGALAAVIASDADWQALALAWVRTLADWSATELLLPDPILSELRMQEEAPWT